jgi:hypothetical protein
MDVRPALGSKTTTSDVKERLAEIDTGRGERARLSALKAISQAPAEYAQVDRVEGVDVHDFAHLLDLPAGAAADADPDLLATGLALLGSEVRRRELEHGRPALEQAAPRLVVERGLAVVEGIEALRLSV